MYIPLYNKSNYSLLSSMLRIDDLIKYATDNKLPSIALTDDNMYGTMEFITKCQKNNIKPIIGLNIITNEFNIVLLAKNYNGYKSLIKLSTIQNEREISIEDLKEYNKEVISILPYRYSDYYKKIKDIYSDLYLGYQNKQEEKEALLITKKIVFFKESLYLEQSDEKYLSYLYKIRDGKTINDNPEYDLSSKELIIPDIYKLTDNEGIIATENISSSCDIEFPKPSNLLPVYECDDPPSYLFELCKAGLKKRLDNNVTDEYKKRLSYELNIINDMGFCNYFLVVYDFIKFAKQKKILVGPGRGSAAGSLVAYCLGITDIDPIKYDLLFERFLNPERKTMPDIDTDFPDNRRDEVINYVREKYGIKRVSGIVTFGTMGAKQVLRDVARVLNVPQYKIDGLCRFIPAFTKEKLADFYKNNMSFKTRIDSDITLTEVFNIALKIEGYPRHTSSHAAGIVMSKIDLDEIIPLTQGDGMYLTSYSMEYLENLGLLKMDFLGLKNLTIIDNILNDIENVTGERIEFSKIPLDDKKTLKLFEIADTSGVFQFESSGMRSFLKRLKPATIEDIFAAIALFRPGAAINIDSYVRRRHNEEKVIYLDPSLKEITKNTYGILIYQEQIMQLAHVYAGYTLGEADILRRAMSKKKLELLKSEEEKFVKKSIEKGHSKEQALQIFELVLNFAGYGFNRSHSVAYSMIAYKMAYLKCYYKTIFFANLLTNAIGSETKTQEYVLEARSNKIEIRKPTISESGYRYLVKDNSIIFPLSNIKSIGTVVTSTIEKAKEAGPFEDLFDCISRLYIAGVGKKTIEVLMNADVFKEFGYNRKTLVTNLDSLFNYAELTKDIDPSLVMKPDIEYQEEYEKSYLLEKEKELFGFYLTGHPTTMYLKDNPYCIPLNTVEKNYSKTVDTLISVDKIKIINTKKGEKMAFLSGSDETSSMEYILFPKVFKEYSDLKRGEILKIRGTVEKRISDLQIIVDKIKRITKDDEDV